jgi:glycosyltransferase involved in cell wall biosynthesis
MKPLVSILIPAFNAQRWIAETLHSAVAQTWRPIEIIVVDDGSTDGTEDVVRQFESAGVRLIQQSNQGAAIARNTAFAASRGEFIQWLDADDLLAPDKIERQMEAWAEAANPRTLLGGAWGKFAYCPERAVFRPTQLWESLSPTEWMLRKLAYNLYMSPCAWLVSRQLSEQAGAWDPRMLLDDDGEYFCRVLMASEGTLFVPAAKGYYRMSGSGSLSYLGRSEEKINAQWLSLQTHITYLLSLEDSLRTRAACVTALQDWFPCFYPEYRGIVAEARGLARQLGGELHTPRLSWKYSWIQRMFGWKLAKRASLFAPRVRWTARRLCDRVRFITRRSLPSKSPESKKFTIATSQGSR